MSCEIPDAPYIARAVGSGNNTMWRQREEEGAEALYPAARLRHMQKRVLPAPSQGGAPAAKSD